MLAKWGAMAAGAKEFRRVFELTFGMLLCCADYWRDLTKSKTETTPIVPT